MFYNVSIFDGEVVGYWKRIHSKFIRLELKILGNLNELLVLLESSQWVGFNEGDLEIFKP